MLQICYETRRKCGRRRRLSEEQIKQQEPAQTPEKKKKNKTEYHLMLFVDNKKEGGVHQMGINRIFIEIVAGLIAVALLVTIIGWAVNSSIRKKVTAENETLSQKVEELSAEVERLTAENSTLSDKVTILSNTVNTKVELETAAQEESDAAHFPQGFPLSSSASMTTSEEDPKCLIFSCSEGTSIISAGEGTVLEVLPDTDYGYCIRIDHENGYITEYYMPCTPLIKEGDAVLQGAILALVESKDTKLAYKIYQDGNQIDPMEVIKIDG